MLEQLPEVQRLSDSEKFQLATELWNELSDSPNIPVDPAIVALLEERNAAFKAGKHPSSPWDEIKKRLSK